jgi:hypothetical protein
MRQAERPMGGCASGCRDMVPVEFWPSAPRPGRTQPGIGEKKNGSLAGGPTRAHGFERTNRSEWVNGSSPRRNKGFDISKKRFLFNTELERNLEKNT